MIIRRLSLKECDQFREIKPLAAAFGSFDGLHLGHHFLFDQVIANDKNFEKGVVSLYPHPAIFFGKMPSRGFVITPLRERYRVLKERGFSKLYLLRFSKEVAAMTAEEFSQRIFFQTLNIYNLYVGEDARLGAGAVGTAQRLKEIFSAAGRRCEIVSLLASKSGDKIGSRQIRELIRLGDFEQVSKFLGRDFIYWGRVARGSRRGAAELVATANIKPTRQILPPNGVYLSRCLIGERVLPAITNVGLRPTFNSQDGKSGGLPQTFIESHILSPEKFDLYGKLIGVSFIKRLRPEIRFDSVNLLKAQILSDVVEAKNFFGVK
ncbi:MAG TPA: riboflavin biosynthesis protein RibF [Oligoflexia bacterium]|nr:riboflavin biosynthesis protein RibF [Oligoflexia bacterium]HMP27818.1 riboflavin biosynthesis protein RibF [Oligoflexia bacterium]